MHLQRNPRIWIPGKVSIQIEKIDLLALFKDQGEGALLLGGPI